MALTSSVKRYPTKIRETLLKQARESIRNGLDHGCALVVDAAGYPAELDELRATFVTLLQNDTLRGCIGTLEAHRPLLNDIAENAYAAAFRDPRFPSLEEGEFDGLVIHLSILSPAEALMFASEQDLIDQLRPGIDGLILSEGGRRGTFLPSVWESLSDPEDFLRHLKQKAGLPQSYWSERVTVERYTTEMIA